MIFVIKKNYCTTANQKLYIDAVVHSEHGLLNQMRHYSKAGRTVRT
jgi:hypothetical protein